MPTITSGAPNATGFGADPRQGCSVGRPPTGGFEVAAGDARRQRVMQRVSPAMVAAVSLLLPLAAWGASRAAGRRRRPRRLCPPDNWCRYRGPGAERGSDAARRAGDEHRVTSRPPLAIAAIASLVPPLGFVITRIHRLAVGASPTFWRRSAATLRGPPLLRLSWSFVMATAHKGGRV